MASFLKSLLRSKEKSKESGKPEAASAVCGRNTSFGRLQSTDVFDIIDLPEEIFIDILSWVPALDVVRHCSLVSKYWLTMSRDCTLWRIKCERERKYVASLMGPPPGNFMIYYFKNPYTRNLLRNPYALEGLNYWVKPSVTRPEVEDSPYGADAILDHVHVKGQVKNWVTSYRFASMSQSVDLLKEGCSEPVLDQMKPDIHASVWCAARWDCGSKFNFIVELQDRDNKEMEKIEMEKDLTDSALRSTWHQVQHTFTGYKPGIRHIVVSMGGVDTYFWAGNYGSKFTCPCVRFVFHQQRPSTN